MILWALDLIFSIPIVIVLESLLGLFNMTDFGRKQKYKWIGGHIDIIIIIQIITIFYWAGPLRGKTARMRRKRIKDSAMNNWTSNYAIMRLKNHRGNIQNAQMKQKKRWQARGEKKLGDKERRE